MRRDRPSQQQAIAYARYGTRGVSFWRTATTLFQRRWAAFSGRPDRERAVTFRCRLTRTRHRSDSVAVSEVKTFGTRRDLTEWGLCGLRLKQVRRRLLSLEGHCERD